MIPHSYFYRSYAGGDGDYCSERGIRSIALIFEDKEYSDSQNTQHP